MEDVELSAVAVTPSTAQLHRTLGSGRRTSGTGRGNGAVLGKGAEAEAMEAKEPEKSDAQWRNSQHTDALQVVHKGEGLSYPDKQRCVAAAPTIRHNAESTVLGD